MNPATVPPTKGFLHQITPDPSNCQAWAIGNEPIVVGRGECADAFVDDDALSRSHFMVAPEGGDYLLIDLNSSNGTWVNGERVSSHKLKQGEIIMAGGSVFYFSLTEAPNPPVPLHVLPSPGGSIPTTRRVA